MITIFTNDPYISCTLTFLYSWVRPPCERSSNLLGYSIPGIRRYRMHTDSLGKLWLICKVYHTLSPWRESNPRSCCYEQPALARLSYMAILSVIVKFCKLWLWLRFLTSTQFLLCSPSRLLSTLLCEPSVMLGWNVILMRITISSEHDTTFC